MERRRRWELSVGLVVAVVGTLVVLAVRPDGGGVTVGAGGDRAALAPSGEMTASVPAPSGPGDGTHPAGLPLTVEPGSDLEDGATVTVSGRGFTPGVEVGIVLCAREARGGGGVAWCDTSVLTSTRVSSEGFFSRPFVVRRWISTPRTGDLDCGDPVDRCAIAAGNLQNYDEAGGFDVTFSSAPPPPGPELTVSPDGPYRDYQEVEVQGRRFADNDPLWIRQCPRDGQPGGPTDGCVDVAPPEQTVDADGTFTTRLRLRRVLPQFSGGSYDCLAHPCALRMRSTTGRTASFTLTFDPKAPWAPDATAELETSYPIDVPIRVDGPRTGR